MLQRLLHDFRFKAGAWMIAGCAFFALFTHYMVSSVPDLSSLKKLTGSISTPPTLYRGAKQASDYAMVIDIGGETVTAYIPYFSYMKMSEKVGFGVLATGSPVTVWLGSRPINGKAGPGVDAWQVYKDKYPVVTRQQFKTYFNRAFIVLRSILALVSIVGFLLIVLAIRSPLVTPLREENL